MDEIVLSVHVARASFNISFYLFGSQIYQRVPIIQNNNSDHFEESSYNLEDSILDDSSWRSGVCSMTGFTVII